MTCLLVLMVLRAMVVICSDCCIQSLATSFITMRLLYMMRKGVASIDSTMAARMGFISAAAPARFPRERQQHKAKLARLRQEQPRAQRHARGRPISRASTRMMTALTSSGTASSASTSAQRSPECASPASCRW